MIMRFDFAAAIVPLAGLAVIVALIVSPALALAASPGKGKAAFVKHGCWECHNFDGQGSIATSNGKIIARTTMSADAFKSFVRNTNGAMPPYRAAILTDDELDDIYAYLQSLPAPRPAGDIPLLKAARSQ
jgi:ubiquinol-cytochrome c reductase cytochrome c subunit